jgi:2-C-methyl-D-erythritol 4-phosphate cytidylyltransferase
MVVVGAGRSLRFGTDKLMTSVHGLPLIAHTIAAVSDAVDRCILVCRQDQIPTLTELDLGIEMVVGGATRTASELAGLEAIGEIPRLIGIHDGARPLVSPRLVETLFQVADEAGGALPVMEPGLPLVRRSDLSLLGGALVAQTPQVFRAEPLLAAYRLAAASGFEGHDTAAVVDEFGRLEIRGVPGDPGNIKVTTPDDMRRVRSVLETSRIEPR